MRNFLRARLLKVLIPVTASLVTAAGMPPAQAAYVSHVPHTGVRDSCARAGGPYQRQVEGLLRLRVDGVQSAADCLAIQRYQKSQVIVPADGFAGPITYTALYREWALNHPGQLHGCPPKRGRVACVDLGHQIMWVRSAGKVVFPPVAIRSGRAAYATRTGWFRVGRRILDEWSTRYRAPMPFSQYFSGGQAIHGVYSNLYAGPGSHGCVNLRYDDARRLWKAIKRGTPVHVWGRKPGT
ncbi:murein L,D-transpeptidase [Streptomyces lasiicapitis]|uniref:Murein L,D-transpeptidase n=2 Tax=Streptomyces lasiicapitis TaxID=1923961 RepID=A0ABQ2MHL2_9ACTN|nr:murein L,D-transpeptidase [Streptomyces lasiicapitis]